MIPLLITISFILHFITLFIIVLQSIRIRKLSENDGTNKEFKREVEETLSSYLLEMKEENEKFLQDLATIEKSMPEEVSTTPSNVHTFSSPVTRKVKRVLPKAEEEFILPLPEESDVFEQSYESQVLSLSKQGFTPDEIAKKMNKGKTEINLLLKFRQERS